MDEFFDDAKFLASFIGCNIFEISQPKATENLFYIKGRGCEDKGFYSSNGFTVQKGSVIARPSGTEPKVKFYYTAVAEDKAAAKSLLDAMVAQMSV